ncbi:MAG: 30S ribosomal protein S3 [candidate division WOR-3 bacterium]
MGQKVHPVGFRLGITKDWTSRWFADKKRFPAYLREDMEIRRLIMRQYSGADISKIVIDRAAQRVTVTIYTGKPGVIIGRRGADVEALRAELARMTGLRGLGVNIQEITNPETDAQIVAENIARQIEKRVSHRRAMKRAVENALRMGAKGIKIRCKGRLGGAEIARKEWYLRGRVPLQTLRANIDYGFATCFTKYGTIGVKVWIYKGEKLGPRQVETEE